MATIRVAAQGRVGAPADRVYAILADYNQHHPKILPPAFTGLTVEEGGVGAGTVFSLTLKVAGRTRTSRGGFFERAFAPRLLKRIYLQELENLDRYARQQATV